MEKVIFLRKRKIDPKQEIKKRAIARTGREFDLLTSGKKPTLKSVAKLMQEVNSFVKAINPNSGSKSRVIQRKRHLRQIYESRTAQEMANRRRITVSGKKNSEGILEEQWGCHQQSIVLAQALQKIGIDAKVGRYFMSRAETGNTPHSTVFFELNNKMYEADTYYLTIEEVNDEKMKIVTFVPAKPLPFSEFKKQKISGKI